jgi:hypothetical protein
MSALAHHIHPLLLATSINLRFNLSGLGALIAGVLILFFPKLLNYIVAIYLIFVGLVQVFNLKV